VGKSASATFVSRSEEFVHADYTEPYCFYYNGFQHRMLESYFPLLVKLAAMASIASVLARSNRFKNLLMGETRTLNQRVALSLVAGQRLRGQRGHPRGQQGAIRRPIWAWKAA
jgi:hypothetical protein